MRFSTKNKSFVAIKPARMSMSETILLFTMKTKNDSSFHMLRRLLSSVPKGGKIQLGKQDLK